MLEYTQRLLVASAWIAYWTLPKALAWLADIGGTNARFALVALDQPRPRLLAPQSRPTAAYGDLSEAAGAYLEEQWYLGRPLTASIAVANRNSATWSRAATASIEFSKGAS